MEDPFEKNTIHRKTQNEKSQSAQAEVSTK